MIGKENLPGGWSERGRGWVVGWEGKKRVVEGCNLRYDRCQSHHAEYNLLEQTKIPLVPLCHPSSESKASSFPQTTTSFTPFLPKPQTAHLPQPHPFPFSRLALLLYIEYFIGRTRDPMRCGLSLFCIYVYSSTELLKVKVPPFFGLVLLINCFSFGSGK